MCKITLVLILIATTVLSSTKKSTEVVYLNQLYMGIKIFLQTRMKDAKSWDDLLESNILSPETIKLASETLSFQSRYGFLPDDRIFKGTYPPERILVMAISSGKEGNRRRADETSEEGRWLIVATKEHGIHTRWHSEVKLERMFAESGLDLMDFTGVEGKWANRDELLAASKEEAIPNNADAKFDSQGKNRAKDSTGTRRPKKGVSGRDLVPESVDPTKGTVPLWVWFASLSVALTVGISVLLRLRRRALSNQEDR